MEIEENTVKTEQNRTTVAKEAMLQALKSTLGIVSPALDKAGVGRATFYGWLDTDPVFKYACEEVNELSLDFTESKLMQSIQNGSDTAIMFHLKTKGKKRGYVERSEFVVSKLGKDLTEEIYE